MEEEKSLRHKPAYAYSTHESSTVLLISDRSIYNLDYQAPEDPVSWQQSALTINDNKPLFAEQVALTI
jgi:hypothetical protein